MPIALSAIVKPSRLLRLALAAYGLACACAACAMAFWQPARFHGAPWLAGACALAALLAWRRAWTPPKPRQIDISGLGEIRVSVQQSVGAAPPPPEHWQLQPGSTVLPALLIWLLRKGAGGALLVVPILPDSVSAGQFRKLAVATRVIAGRDNKFSENNKIL